MCVCLRKRERENLSYTLMTYLLDCLHAHFILHISVLLLLWPCQVQKAYLDLVADHIKIRSCFESAILALLVNVYVVVSLF